MQEFGDLNAEMDTTVPTDLTISSFLSDDGVNRRRKPKANMLEDYFKERKELRKQVHILNMELTKKNALINSLKGELSMKTEEYRDKLESVLHEKHLIQTKLKTQLKLIDEESSLKSSIAKRELSSLKAKNEELENMLQRLQDFVEDFAFADLNAQTVRSHEKPTRVDYIVNIMKEWAGNIQKENTILKTAAAKLQDQVHNLQSKLADCQEELQKEKLQSSQLEENKNSLLTKLNAFQSHSEHRNYAQENFARVQYERDRFHNEILDLKKNIESLKAELIEVQQEKESTREELMKVKQDQALLQRECETLNLQLGDAVQKWGEFQDKACTLQSELNIERLSREELLNRFTNSRDKLRENYDERLEQERNKIKMEMNQLHEKETRSLSESRASAVRQREAAESAMVEFRIKYEQLYARFHETSTHDSAEIKKLRRELDETKMDYSKKNAAMEQLKLAHEKKLGESSGANLKLQVTEKELENLKSSTSERIQALEGELASCKAKLEIYQDLEKELNDVIAEAALVEETDAEAVVDKVAGGIPLPSNARYTFSRCVNLTKKVMELERKILLLQNELQSEKTKQKKASEELMEANKLLQQVQQPYGYLIATVKENEEYIERLKTEIADLKKRVLAAKREKDSILAEKNQLAAALKESQTNKEEFLKVKDQVQLLMQKKSAETSDARIEEYQTKRIASNKKKTSPKKK